MILPAAIGKRAIDRRLLAGGPEHHTRAPAAADRDRIPTARGICQAACHHAAFDSGDRSCAEAEAHRTVAAIQPTQAVPDETEA